jgi:hypothetical protein
MDIRENSLSRHGEKCSLGVLRFYLAPSALGAAQDDSGKRFHPGHLLLRDAGSAGDAPSIAVSPRSEAGDEFSHACPADFNSNAATIAFARAAAVNDR